MKRIVSPREILEEAKRLKVNYMLMYQALEEIAVLEHYEAEHKDEMSEITYVRALATFVLETVEDSREQGH